MKKIRAAAVGFAALAALGLAATATVTASADVPGQSAASNVIQIPLTRVVDVPGIALTNASSTAVVPVAGTHGIPATATGISGRLVAYEDSGTSRLVVWDGQGGAPGTPTVVGTATSSSFPSGASSAFASALSGGNVSVHLAGAATHFLLEVDSYTVPAPAAGSGPAGPKGDKGDTGDTGAAGANGANGKDAAILDGQLQAASVDLAHIGGPFAANHTALNFGGQNTVAVPGTGSELVHFSITFCRDGAQDGAPTFTPNVVVHDVTDSSNVATLASDYGPKLDAANAQVNCGIESTVADDVVATGGHTLEVDVFGYDDDQSATGTVKVDYGSLDLISLGAAN